MAGLRCYSLAYLKRRSILWEIQRRSRLADKTYLELLKEMFSSGRGEWVSFSQSQPPTDMDVEVPNKEDSPEKSEAEECDEDEMIE